MKFKDLQQNLFVYDTWWPDKLGQGRISKILKTRVHIEFEHEIIVYDKAHVQFLEYI